MGLEGEGAAVLDPAAFLTAAAGIAFLLGVFRENLAVDADGDVFVLHLDVIIKPSVVGNGFFRDVFDRVEAAGAPGIFHEGVIHLAFVALEWPAVFLIFGGEDDAAVGVLLRHDLGLELKVLPLRVIHVAGVEEVAAAAFDMDRAIP